MARPANQSREESLRKALDLFWSKGFHNTSLKDLEQALNMRPGSIYAAFTSKEALFCEALNDYGRAAKADYVQVMDAHASSVDGLIAYVRDMATQHDRDLPARACMAVKTVLEMPADQGAMREGAETLLKGFEQAFTQAFAKAIAAGEVDDDKSPERLARKFQADVTGMRVLSEHRSGGGNINERVEDIVDWLEGLKVKAGVPARTASSH
ncbi:TetR/AcrR family transcriptional regulator [uncultured Maricaulis sp.]|uniref:TetR/AcrR family transcriptional regulator n=1 Tax=uncultured Maricaulis sp. TaxID=174710 RepID=UPI0030D6F3DF|tara:strand:+ start:56431 stop:57060 length:630 start_codon:yes stop_codon:yes gene_type:complete